MSRPRCLVRSSEAVYVSAAIQEALEHDAGVTVWNDTGFELSGIATESLSDILPSLHV
jgi:hypothetical protein